jgi:hypothetical protein
VQGQAKIFYSDRICRREPGSSVGIVRQLAGRRGVRGSIPGSGERIFPLASLTGSEAHPALCTMGTWDPFPGAKACPGRDADNSPPSSAEVENE